MADPTVDSSQPSPSDEPANEPKPQSAKLEQGTYEIIRNRLTAHSKQLRQRLNQLNQARKDVFGSIETKLINTDRITTANNCIPRDMVAVGDQFIVGYNVHFGLKTEINLSDVFTIYSFKDGAFHEQPLDLINNETFQRDFKEVYRYYKNTTFAKFFRKPPYLYMVFRVGQNATDIKAFKWSLDGGELTYLNARSDHEVSYPAQHEFQWKRATRDQQQQGKYPHVSIEDMVFVETTGGDLTIKIENNTDTGEGIYAEPVDNADQSLDDAEFYYTILGHLVLLKIRPFQESNYRYFIFNTKLQNVVRIDAIADSCVLLPEDHGLIFSNGYYLTNGDYQLFPAEFENMMFERRIASPNGEDTLYMFYQRQQGVYVMLSYNMIEQRIDQPVVCNGFSFFEDGKVLLLKGQEEPQKHHSLQVWQTPYVGPNVTIKGNADSYLYKIGNRDIVRGMAECYEILKLLDRDDIYEQLYIDLVRQSTAMLDAYFWLSHAETFKLGEILQGIKESAQAAISEFEKVSRIRRNTTKQVKQVSQETRDLVTQNATRIYDSINPFVEALAGLRRIRGQIISLRDLRYVEVELVDHLEKEVQEQTEKVSRRTVEFLLKPKSLEPYHEAALAHASQIEGLKKVAQAKELDEQVAQSSADLEMLIDIVSNLKIEDATQRTVIIDNISAIFSDLNAARTKLKNRMQDLAHDEGIAEFNSQLKLLNQSVVNYLDLCDTPEKTDQFLTKMMVQLEELEGRFAEFDEFVTQLSEKREEIYNAFENRKLQLVEKRNKRTNALANAADRILKGIKGRVDSLDAINEINAYFASDLMVSKVRDIVEELTELGDSVKVDDILSRLKTVQEDTVRQLKDKQELFVDGQDIIKFGKHHFSVNTQPIDLTILPHNGQMNLHLSGTKFFEAITDEAFNQTRGVWDQQIVSENKTVYRSEYLAYLMFQSMGNNGLPPVERLATVDDEQALQYVQQFMGSRYSGGYTKGVHDHDAAIILRALLELNTSIDLLRYSSEARAMAQLFWRCYDKPAHKQLIQSQLTGFGTIASLFTGATRQEQYISELQQLIRDETANQGIFNSERADEAGEYLFYELVSGANSYVLSPEALHCHDAFMTYLKQSRALRKYEDSVSGVASHPVNHFLLVRDWVGAYLEEHSDQTKTDDERDAHPTNATHPTDKFEFLNETTILLTDGKFDRKREIKTSVKRPLNDLIGSHALIDHSQLDLHYNQFMTRLGRFSKIEVPKFEQYTQLKRQITETARQEMRLDEFKPRVLTSFVRNKLLDKVYLPLIGANLAKQIGEAGDAKRTDRMGMLLLISPPGYGKTTLMEYIANRLGIIFMKINGPALGHSVTSLDPVEAPNAAAREELNKLNLSLEMGDNVMIYIDDIQHTNSEFLQKFISLCDAQRKIEGIYKGKSRTYDLRGRKVAVVMAGNPYTESGEKFAIPDMLANRADTYNLGDIIGEHGDAFKMSYLENSLTSNTALSKLASRSQEDVYAIIKIAETGSRDGVDFESNLGLDEINEMVSVMKKLITVRNVILTVNQQYILSAGMEDQYRTEPAFQLQGSYRNMNRIAERVMPIMNDEELQILIVSSYEQDSQTLTTGAESNLLKFKEMIGIMTEEETKRWDAIKRTFQRNNAMRGIGGDDRTAQILTQMSGFNQNLEDITGAIKHAVETSQNNAASQPQAEDASGLTEQNIAAVTQGMASFTEGLASIRQTLHDGIDRLAKLQQAKPKARKADPSEELRTIQLESKFDKPTQKAIQAISDQLGLMVKRMEAAAEAQAAKPTDATGQDAQTDSDTPPPLPPQQLPHEIHVINKIPATFLAVIKEQFQLMQDWLRPLTAKAEQHDRHLDQIRQVLQDILERYDKIIKKLEKD